MKILSSKKFPKSNGHYSQCIQHNGILYLSGQLPIDQTNREIPETIEAQADLAFKNVETILIEAGSSKDKVLQVRVYIPNIELWDKVNDRYSLFFGDHKPVRCIVPTRELHFGCLIELEVTAMANWQKEDIIQSHRRIAPYIYNTPVLSSKLINQIVGANLFFKCENFQKVGAFKMRGATNAIMQLTDDQKKKGVVTHSSGNFAQALSLAAKSLGVKAYIVMPSNVIQVKLDAVKAYEAEVTFSEPTLRDREKKSLEIQQRVGATFIHPSNNTDVIIGQGTACKELLEIHPDLEYIFAPVGGGGLIAGTALSAHCFGNNCKVIGGEPFEVDDAYRSLQSGVIESNQSTNTIADGLKTELGDKNFPIIQKYVDRITRVTEEEIVSAMRLLWDRMKIVIEPSSAVALAAVIREKDLLKNKNVGIILSGGNVDLTKLPF
jgi:reactive intermediate/imine deaminase